MLRFLKILARNLVQGPATDPFPFKAAHTPERFRGRVTMDPDKCVGCAICRHVCAGRAIRLEPNEEKTGYEFTIWHNTCALCGMCRHFCPTKAITLTNDWHNVHAQTAKYDWAEHHFVPYLRCAGCEAPIRMLPPELATRVYAHSPVDMTELMKLCPACRQVAAARRDSELHRGGANAAKLSSGGDTQSSDAVKSNNGAEAAQDAAKPNNSAETAQANAKSGSVKKMQANAQPSGDAGITVDSQGDGHAAKHE